MKSAQIDSSDSSQPQGMDFGPDGPSKSRQSLQGKGGGGGGGQLSTTRGKLMEVVIDAQELSKQQQQGHKLQGRHDENVPAKPRLGPDGKPWRSKKNRRGSDDVARDKMVEDFLHENRREFTIFPFPPHPPNMLVAIPIATRPIICFFFLFLC